MSEENVEIIRRAYEAYDRGDRYAFVADIAPECEFVAAGTVPGRTGTYRGPEGYKKFVAWLDEEFSDSHAELDAIIDAGDSVVVGATLRGRGRQSGIPATFTFWQVWAFANGQIVGGQGFANKAQALARRAVGVGDVGGERRDCAAGNQPDWRCRIPARV